MKTSRAVAWIQLVTTLVLWLCVLPFALTLPRTLWLILATGVGFWWFLFFAQLLFALVAVSLTPHVLMYVLVCIEQFDKAEEVVHRPWVSFLRQDKQMRWSLASALCNEGLYERADGLIAPLLVLPVGTHCINAWLIKARICIAQGDLEQAESIVQEANVWRNRNPLQRIGKPFDVTAIANRSKRIESSDPGFRNRLCAGLAIFYGILAVIGAKYCTDSPTMFPTIVYPSLHDICFIEASMMMGNKQYDKALAFLDKAATDAPPDRQDYSARASVCHASKKYTEEIDALKKAIELESTNLIHGFTKVSTFSLRSRLVTAYIASAQYDKAIQALDAFPVLTDSWLICHQKANIYLIRGDGASASELALKVPMASQYFRSSKVIEYFAYRLQHQTAKAQDVLADLEKECTKLQWSSLMVRYLKDEIDDSQLLAKADSDRQLVVAHTIIGQQEALAGKSEKARLNFQWVINKVSDSGESAISAAWLRRLDQLGPSKPAA